MFSFNQFELSLPKNLMFKNIKFKPVLKLDWSMQSLFCKNQSFLLNYLEAKLLSINLRISSNKLILTKKEQFTKILSIIQARQKKYENYQIQTNVNNLWFQRFKNQKKWLFHSKRSEYSDQII
ncbi:hypothetical protein ABPG73_018423 [Tetrahymena malaccensis]